MASLTVWWLTLCPACAGLPLPFYTEAEMMEWTEAHVLATGHACWTWSEDTQHVRTSGPLLVAR